MKLERMAMSVLQPGFDGTEPPDWLRRALGDGLGGVVLFARNLSDRESTAGLVASIRGESPDVIVAVDEEGGAVTRLEARTGSSWPGNRALGVADDLATTGRAAAFGSRRAARFFRHPYREHPDRNRASQFADRFPLARLGVAHNARPRRAEPVMG